MAEEQLGTPVGAGVIVDPEMAPKLNNSGTNLDAVVFGATKSIATMRSTLKNISGVVNGLYTDAYLDSMTANDMLYAILDEQDAVVEADAAPTVWATDTAYDRGVRVTNSGKTLQATNSGTSDDTVTPSNPGTGKTVVDNDITWYQVN